MDEKRKLQKEQQKLHEQMAYDTLVTRGNQYLQLFGQAIVNQDIDQMKANLIVWNRLSKASIRYSLQTIDTMMQVWSTMPFIVGVDLINRKEYIDHGNRLSAIRNHIIKERDQRIKDGTQSELSTPEVDNP